MDSRIVVIEPPAPIVTWDEMKIHAKIEEESEKTYVETLVSAATSWLDGPTGWLGRSIGVQVLETRWSSWSDMEEGLPYPPELEIVSISYVDPEGATQTWPISEPVLWDDLPPLRGEAGDLKIRYRAGYGARDPDDVTKWISSPPPALKVAVMMLAAQWYENREAVSVGASVEKLPFAVEALVQPYRVYR